MAKTHELKTVNPYFQDVWEGRKNFEIRHDDRDYQVGDTLVLKEYDSLSESYLSRSLTVLVNYVLPEEKFPPGLRHGIKMDYVVMAIQEIERSSSS